MKQNLKNKIEFCASEEETPVLLTDYSVCGSKMTPIIKRLILNFDRNPRKHSNGSQQHNSSMNKPSRYFAVAQKETISRILYCNCFSH